MAVSGGLVLGGYGILLTGTGNLIWPGYGQQFLSTMSSVYPGFHATRNLIDVLVGSGYGFLDGAFGHLQGCAIPEPGGVPVPED